MPRGRRLAVNLAALAAGAVVIAWAGCGGESDSSGQPEPPAGESAANPSDATGGSGGTSPESGAEQQATGPSAPPERGSEATPPGDANSPQARELRSELIEELTGDRDSGEIERLRDQLDELTGPPKLTPQARRERARQRAREAERDRSRDDDRRGPGPGGGPPGAESRP